MTTREVTPLDAALVAIDVSKARNDVLIELPGSRRRRRFAIRRAHSATSSVRHW